MIYDLIVVGAGPSGIMASISAANDGKRVLLLEKMPQIALKLKATGGGKCNLTNTLEKDEFCEKFGKSGRFIKDALDTFSRDDLLGFFASIGVETIARDGFRIFPINHSSTLILEALNSELVRVKVEVKTSIKIKSIKKEEEIFFINTDIEIIKSKNIILACGGKGYPTLGATGDGYIFAESLGHSVTKTHPAMMPLFTKEKNFASCKADTIAKAILKVDIKKYKNLKLIGDLIFTKDGLRGPVILDFAREITPILEKYDEVPLLISFLKGRNEDEIYKTLKDEIAKNPEDNILQNLEKLLANSVANEILNICEIKNSLRFKQIDGIKREKLVKTLAWTPFTIIGHDGFRQAMITRGGISLKEIDSKTMQSKVLNGLYFCGEIVDIDGPCGGYNLQWSFSSGYLAGKLRV
ncbi:tricarballylate dehydrogenase [Aliarcobacter thereius]|uniref:Tricarballylate dehydrogenase n=1 Tax=Aliarcobacter thereius LMG 24486 TaxID=1032240 RepID=A0A1C7WQI9_9BACT|nr:NAD(P)/FAD-dependent oxidoreductase [Aliarcobacter thereius]OCL85478.1 tricarballylate dehydrogenase [Aliarcobacter thereius]OCL90417.1 tricarballylate dehydrogenase [Aliarcobacter thereius]OCL95828.1 tricarballylate dehydrogenase [Aliarcobacter thereius LMG 24486]QBF16198.1 flavoprotein, HI0933 family [Aliarcobacter thereius LMG 24486]TLS92175.1 NAD(P)/FAD-dependent oxidoreductase [Aliarcobacter thereius]